MSKSTKPKKEKKSKRDTWGTPLSVFQPLHDEFDFGLDACALPENNKLPRYLTPADDGLAVDWCAQSFGKPVWCNPPYSDMLAWMRKAKAEADKGLVVVCLVEARVETQWFRWAALAPTTERGIMIPNADIRFLWPRIPFEVSRGVAKKSTGMIGSVVVVLGTAVKSIRWHNWRDN